MAYIQSMESGFKPRQVCLNTAFLEALRIRVECYTGCGVRGYSILPGQTFLQISFKHLSLFLEFTLTLAANFFALRVIALTLLFLRTSSFSCLAVYIPVSSENVMPATHLPLLFSPPSPKHPPRLSEISRFYHFFLEIIKPCFQFWRKWIGGEIWELEGIKMLDLILGLFIFVVSQDIQEEMRKETTGREARGLKFFFRKYLLSIWLQTLNRNFQIPSPWLLPLLFWKAAFEHS